MKIVIFYSWQSKTNEKNNRYFILDSLRSAIKSINVKKHPELTDVEFEIQEGTSGLPGMPDIPETIDSRISNCDIYVCDLSVISHYTLLERLKYALRPSIKKRELPISNNVLLEYGQARHAVGDSRIIAIMNTAIEDPEKYPNIIPFDINERRHPIFYSHKEKMLSIALKSAIIDNAVEAIKVRRNKYAPFITWSEHQYTINSSIPFVSCTKSDEVLSLVKECQSDFRILGLSGIGKTRMLWEAFRDTKDIAYSNTYLYYDYVTETKERAYSVLEKILSSSSDNQSLVIDNCTREFALKIIALKASLHATNRLITLYNEPEELENQISDVHYVLISGSDMEPVVDSILSDLNERIPEEKRRIIKDFSSGLPMMAVIMAENFKSGKDDYTKLSNSDFVDRLLISSESEEMELMKSLSLFKYVGYKDDLRKYVEFIVSDSTITPLISGDKDYRIAVFDKSFNKYSKREIYEVKGRLFGVRPRPLSFFLAQKWFDTCTSDRLLKVAEVIRAKDIEFGGKLLTEGLCEQIKYLTGYKQAAKLVESLTGANSPFANAEVLNTELGSRLFRSFVEVDPVSVANLLWKVFGEMTTDELLNVKDGRRNLVWTTQKLCFDKRTFIIGTKLLILFSIAENETWGNNATNEALNLFHIYLPGTEADLNQRLEIVKWTRNLDGADELFIKVLSSALTCQHYTYVNGAESQGANRLEHYVPSGAEIIDYWNNISDILKDYVEMNPDKIDQASKIVSDNFSGLIRVGVPDIAFNLAKFIAEKRDWNWDDMRDCIRLMFWRKSSKDYPETLATRLKSLQAKLTKNDFVSRLKEVERYESDRWEDELRRRNELYKELASEYVTSEQTSLTLLKDILSDPSVTPYASFGEEIYNCIKEDKVAFRNVADTIIMTSRQKNNPANNILLGYFGHADEDDFEYAYSHLKESMPESLYPLFAIRHKSLDQCSELFEMANAGVADDKAFDMFCRYYDWGIASHDAIIDFYEQLARMSSTGAKISMERINSMLYFDARDGRFAFILDKYKELIVSEVFPVELDNEDYMAHIETIIDKYCSPEVAKFISQKLIAHYLSDSSVANHSGHHADTVLNILFDKYFDEVWPDWSVTLVEPDNILFSYMLKFKLGMSIGGLTGGALFGADHYDELTQWCTDYPDSAPILLAMYVPVYAGESLSPLAKFLLDNYGDNKRVLSELSCNLGSFSCVGSAVPIYEHKKRALQELIPHKNPTVNQWLQDNIRYAENDIAREIDRDAEDTILYR